MYLEARDSYLNSADERDSSLKKFATVPRREAYRRFSIASRIFHYSGIRIHLGAFHGHTNTTWQHVAGARCSLCEDADTFFTKRFSFRGALLEERARGMMRGGNGLDKEQATNGKGGGRGWREGGDGMGNGETEHFVKQGKMRLRRGTTAAFLSLQNYVFHRPPPYLSKHNKFPLCPPVLSAPPLFPFQRPRCLFFRSSASRSLLLSLLPSHTLVILYLSHMYGDICEVANTHTYVHGAARLSVDPRSAFSLATEIEYPPSTVGLEDPGDSENMWLRYPVTWNLSITILPCYCLVTGFIRHYSFRMRSLLCPFRAQKDVERT